MLVFSMCPEIVIRIMSRKVKTTFITNFGKVNQKQKEVVIRLESNRDIIDVGNFSFTDN